MDGTRDHMQNKISQAQKAMFSHVLTHSSLHDDDGDNDGDGDKMMVTIIMGYECEGGLSGGG
jgi:hypothetical protein